VCFMGVYGFFFFFSSVQVFKSIEYLSVILFFFSKY